MVSRKMQEDSTERCARGVSEIVRPTKTQYRIPSEESASRKAVDIFVVACEHQAGSAGESKDIYSASAVSKWKAVLAATYPVMHCHELSLLE